MPLACPRCLSSFCSIRSRAEAELDPSASIQPGAQTRSCWVWRFDQRTKSRGRWISANQRLIKVRWFPKANNPHLWLQVTERRMAWKPGLRSTFCFRGFLTSFELLWGWSFPKMLSFEWTQFRAAQNRTCECSAGTSWSPLP